jgi:hypothetical protein
MPTSPERFDRKLYNRARVALSLASAAGSTAWSLAGRATAPVPGLTFMGPVRIEFGDRALPIINRN